MWERVKIASIFFSVIVDFFAAFRGPGAFSDEIVPVVVEEAQFSTLNIVRVQFTPFLLASKQSLGQGAVLINFLNDCPVDSDA